MKKKNYILYGIIAILLVIIIALVIMLISIYNKDNQQNNKANENIVSSNSNSASELKKDKEENNKDKINVNMQIKIIVDNKDLWLQDDDYVNYVYAITDLDQNGRLEIISTSIQGSGLYAYNDFYEVNTNLDGIDKILTDIKEGDSQSDIGIDKTQAFYDRINDKYYYVFTDTIRLNSYEYHNSKKIMMLKNGFITDDFIAYKTIVYKNETDDPIERYYDKDSNFITKEQYEKVDKLLYGEMIEKEVTFNWNKISKDISNNQIISVLTKSYTGFSLNNI